MIERISNSKCVNERKAIIENPLVSIITPVLNGSKYLEACLQSVLSQSYPNIEHIFVDGGSSDGTLDLLANYQKKYPDRIRYIVGRDEGIGDAVNKGMRIAKGEIFGWLDSDNTYEKDAILAVVEFFKLNADACFVFGEANQIDKAGEVVGKYLIKEFNLKQVINERGYMNNQSTFYRREVIERAGSYNTLGNCDEFWVRVGKIFPMHRIEKLLSNNRITEDTTYLSSNPSKRRILRDRLRENYTMCRENGGHIFSPRCRQYFAFLVADNLKIYNFIIRPLILARGRHPFLHKALIMLGL